MACADSKQLTAARRAELSPQIREHALAWHVAWADVEEIDCLNILGATLLAMRRAVSGLVAACPRWCRWMATVCRDCGSAASGSKPWCAAMRTVAAISAASILAKQARDALMRPARAPIPGYQFAVHKGYATPDHLEALTRLGPSPQHRRSFAPVREANNSFGR